MIGQIRLILFSRVAFENNVNDVDLLSVTITALWVSKVSFSNLRCSWYVSISRPFYTKITEKHITLALSNNCQKFFFF